MKIYQLLPTLAFGDAVSNDALALEKVIREMGYKTEIFAESIDARLPKGSAKFVEKLPRLNEKDIILYHLSTGTKLNYRAGTDALQKSYGVSQYYAAAVF